MTDRTTELLCKLLDERGISWKKRRGYIRWSKQTKYGVTHYQAWPCLDGTITLTVRDEYGITPDQAIAATLGNDKKLITIALQLVRDHYCYTERFDESCIELERWCHDHGETDLMEYAMALRCPACAFVPMDDVEDGQSAKLTAEQVRELIAPHLHARPTFDFGRHGAVWRADFQAIADELNTRAERTCVLLDRGKFMPHHEFYRVVCSECGILFWQSHGHLPMAQYCPGCGAKVVSE